MKVIIAFVAGALIGGLAAVALGQVPTIVIPPNWQGIVCAAYEKQAAACKDANVVRQFLNLRSDAKGKS
jgi:uncharacterized membrane protein YoaK (UPF0700 family)